VLRRLLYATVLMLLTSAGCGGGSNSVPAPPPPQIHITIRPVTATVPVDTIQPFVAFVSGAPGSSVIWTTSAGTIDQSGNYTAPSSIPQAGTVTVTATVTGSTSAAASATVAITSEPVTLKIAPSTATLKAGFSAVYTANVGGTSNTSVIWSVADRPGDPTYPGSMAGSIYTAPSPLFTPDSFTVTAVSTADPTKADSASVNVVPLENQELQTSPIKLGASGINANTGDCCSGTLGSLLVDQKGKHYILSNNHVLGRVGHAAQGEAVVQPGYVDTFCDFTLPKTVANFSLAPPITSSNVDAAIAQVVPGAVDDRGEIIGLGGIANDGSYIPAAPAKTTVAPAIGMAVAKSGRTTGLTCGTVLATNGTVLIDVPTECGNTTEITVSFRGQVVMGSIARPGDSGSLIVEAGTARPVGLLAAGSIDGQYIIANPITEVLAALKASAGSPFSFVGSGQHSVSCSGVTGAVGHSSLQEPVKAVSSFIPAERIAHAMDVQWNHENELMLDPAVIGTAIARNEQDPQQPSLLVFVEAEKTPRHLPSVIDGVAVRLIPSGRFRANLQPSSVTGGKCTAQKRSGAFEKLEQH
jgi:hypothetical protein